METITDREEHEFAAKAAGIDVAWMGPHTPREWSPKTSNADAFGLMVACHMDVDFFREDTGGAVDIYFLRGERVTEPEGDDLEAATRRAIFRAAVEIGVIAKANDPVTVDSASSLAITKCPETRTHD